MDEVRLLRTERRIAATERELAEARMAIRQLAAMVEELASERFAARADQVRALVAAPLARISSESQDTVAVVPFTQA